ncbi:hypothetical protein T4A_13291 [Trichinella pseudospiralis]|uniref:Uncharacterized protein n=1 Tax=Trichinella pseudospiralis TaxID=6337 RepID=A0A0V1DWL5_TRIPS|nr:hypothetical protein T4A_13291 [Trichinella pseudospiralis]
MRKDGTDFANAGNAISFGQLLSKMKLHADRIAALYTRTSNSGLADVMLVSTRLLKADYSNMYDNSTKQSLLLIGYFSGNAIELYRFGLNPSAGFFVSYFLISIIEKMHLFQSWLSVCPGRLAFVSICFSTIQADKCQLRRNRSSNCETTLTVTCCGEWSTAENDQVTIRV